MINGTIHIRRPLGKRFDNIYVVAAMKYSLSQMIWGAMSCRGVVGSYVILSNTTINELKFVELLKEKLMHMHVHGCTIFMQDGASCHRSKLDTELLNKYLLEWPGNSPDHNPIENLWIIMKDKLAYQQPPSSENPKQAIKDVCVIKITQEFCESRIFCVRHRIQAVIDRKGHTK